MAKHRKGFDKLDRDLSKYAGALAFPVRLAIIRILLGNEGWVPIGLFACLALDEQAVEKHLQELEKAGLIELRTVTGMAHARINQENFYILSNGFIHLLENYK